MYKKEKEILTYFELSSIFFSTPSICKYEVNWNSMTDLAVSKGLLYDGFGDFFDFSVSFAAEDCSRSGERLLMPLTA